MSTALIEAQADQSVELSDDELVDESVLFVTGGRETAALTVTYAFGRPTRHPEHRCRVVDVTRSVPDGPGSVETVSVVPPVSVERPRRRVADTQT